MEFRAPSVAEDLNTSARTYLTINLSNPDAGSKQFDALVKKLGNSVECYPVWHPILTAPTNKRSYGNTLNMLYEGSDHTSKFVKGFVTCPYSSVRADELVSLANSFPGIYAYRLTNPLYADNAYPVVVEAVDIELAGDGTICSRQAIALFVQETISHAKTAECAESWWDERTEILGLPHGSRSSLFVNQYTGGQMRKILDALNNSGVFGPLIEWSLDMLPKKKQNKICQTLMQTAFTKFQLDKQAYEFEFELNGETCTVEINDAFNDGSELSIQIYIGDKDEPSLRVSGFYYSNKGTFEPIDLKGKRAIAEKFA